MAPRRAARRRSSAGRRSSTSSSCGSRASRTRATCVRSRDQLAGGRIALLGRLGEQAVEHRLELDRDPRVDPAGTSRLAVQDPVEDGAGRRARERALAGHHLVEHGAEREQVRARVDRPGRAPAPATCRRRCPIAIPGRVSSVAAVACAASAAVLGASRAAPRRRSGSESLARPKSSTFSCPRAVTNRLAGLMSRCTMPRWCAASSALAICSARSTACVERDRTLLQQLLDASGPCTAPSR